ncbi:hypothetical protein [Sphingomonas glacialis]|uniref:Uncharacterized protein n=1 Tax=Sphingomonas glacialis TaxID=658225 RepID=A0A502FAW9_9SPHN|nr:hypothetical protein [Sphingomonas glacialis]TPG46512.1 hypothetical protein EAH76_23100 [Sphingomonas glacialis]
MNEAVAAIITAIALLAVLAARHGVAQMAARSSVAARLRTLYTLVALLLALRLVAPWVSATPVMIALMGVAAWLPIATLWLVEQLRRRHAPRLVKLLALAGAVGFSILAVTLGLVWTAAAALALALYQLAMLAVMVALLTHNRAGLGQGERRTSDTVLLAILLTIPLAASDFAAVLPGLPVRGGAFAALLLALATARLAAGDGTPRRLLADLAIAAGAGGIGVGIAFSALHGLSEIPALLVAAGCTAIAGLLLIVARAGGGGDATGLIAALAHAPSDDLDTLIAAHPILASGRLLGPAELAGYPDSSITRVLAFRVVSASTGDAETRDAARDLLDAYAATHLIRLSRTPPRLLAVAAGSLTSPRLDDELALAARLIERAA